MTESGRTHARNSAAMAVGTTASRVLGFVRGALMVYVVGDALVGNAFDVANRLPNTLLTFIAAGIGAGVLIPRFVASFERKGGEAYVNRIVTLLLGGTLIITVVATLLAPLWVWLFTLVGEQNAAQTALAVAFAYWCIPQLFFYFAYMVFGQVLNARGEFASYMWAPVVNNIISIVGFGAYIAVFGGLVEDPAEWTPQMIAWVAGTATLGVIGQALTLVIPLRRTGYRWKWQVSGPKGELSSLGALLTWVVGAVALEQIPVLLTTGVLFSVTETGLVGNSGYTYALTLALLPHSILTMSIATATYPALSRAIHARDSAEVGHQTERALNSIGILSIPAAAAVVVTAPFALQIAYPSLPPENIAALAPVLQVLAIGIVPLGTTLIFRRAQIAYDDGRGVFFQHIPVVLLWSGVVLLSVLLPKPWWALGAAVGQTLNYVLSTWIRSRGVSRLAGGLSWARTVRVHLVTIAAAAIAGAAAYGSVLLTQGWVTGTGWQQILPAAGVAIVAGVVLVAVYAALMTWWRIPEWTSIVQLLTARLRRA